MGPPGCGWEGRCGSMAEGEVLGGAEGVCWPGESWDGLGVSSSMGCYAPPPPPLLLLPPPPPPQC